MLPTKSEIKSSVLKGQKRRGKKDGCLGLRFAVLQHLQIAPLDDNKVIRLDRISSDSGVRAVASVCARESIDYDYWSCYSLQHGIDVLQMICIFSA